VCDGEVRARPYGKDSYEIMKRQDGGHHVLIDSVCRKWGLAYGSGTNFI
jgi:hypothetical protein